MARRRQTVEDFPPEYREFVEEVMADPEKELGIEDKNARITMKAQLYKFFAAVRREAEEFWDGVERWKKGRKAGEANPEIPWVVGMADFAKRVTIRDEGGRLKFMPKTQTMVAQILRANTSEGKKVEDAIEESRRRLLAKMPEVESNLTQEDVDDMVRLRGEGFAREFGVTEGMIELAKERVAGMAVGK